MTQTLNWKRAGVDTVAPLDDVTPKPSGWFAVCLSSELAIGANRSIVFCGQELVAFRGEDNAVRLIEGLVVAETPRPAYVRSWPVSEVNGLVVGRHGAGEGAIAELPSLRKHGRRVVHDAQETFTFTHALVERLGVTLEPHQLAVQMHCPGLLVARLRMPWLGLEILTLSALRPIDGLQMEIIAATAIKNWRMATLSRDVRDLIARDVAADFDEDVMVLERKRYRETPVLCAADGPALRIRRWVAQLYGARAAADLFRKAGRGLCDALASHCEAR
jgi:hypothetical protein